LVADITVKVNDEKREAVRFVKEFIEESKDLIFTDYRGLNVAQITDLRNRLKEKDSIYRVIKNNYAKLAFSELGLPSASEFLVGPTALVTTKSEIGPAAKVVLDFAKASTVKIKGGIVAGTAFSSQQMEALSRLPDRDSLLAMVMSAMNGPLSNLVYGLAAMIRGLVLTVKAVADKKAAGETAAGETAAGAPAADKGGADQH
jgi:large subunit ribosomal protein L10